ncbi:hypothetical protein AMTR_s00114p00125020 [Amborella trichopoda]|uniref:Uncharacterized protein n=1 Tax=Amborella trichopoda TaxID=13333 RepID=W1NPV9_AMBTC|nr:hypothetical protein AMTR_s00114p00125020 [Amborella trichopoda]
MNVEPIVLDDPESTSKWTIDLQPECEAEELTWSDVGHDARAGEVARPSARSQRKRVGSTSTSVLETKGKADQEETEDEEVYVEEGNDIDYYDSSTSNLDGGDAHDGSLHDLSD